MNMESLSAIVLAAGQSKRMGSPKALLSIDRTTFFGEVAEALVAQHIPWTVCVTNPDLALRLSPLSNFTVLLENADPASEQLDSLRIGLRWLEENVPNSEGAFILLVDNPGGVGERLQIMQDAVVDRPEEVLVAAYKGRAGHPMWLPRRLWEGLLAYEGRDGTEGYLRAAGESVSCVETEVPGAVRNVDTPEQYERLTEQGRAES